MKQWSDLQIHCRSPKTKNTKTDLSGRWFFKVRQSCSAGEFRVLQDLNRHKVNWKSLKFHDVKSEMWRFKSFSADLMSPKNESSIITLPRPPLRLSGYFYTFRSVKPTCCHIRRHVRNTSFIKVISFTVEATWPTPSLSACSSGHLGAAGTETQQNQMSSCRRWFITQISWLLTVTNIKKTELFLSAAKHRI